LECIYQKKRKPKFLNNTAEANQTQVTLKGKLLFLLTELTTLTGHLKNNRKDFNTERSLVKLVGKRRSLLDYLKNNDIVRYRELIKELNIRK